MEVTKRTYQKHKTEKKITVKHYFQKTVKGKDQLNELAYPVYMQVIYMRKTTTIKSRIKSFPRWIVNSRPEILDKFKQETQRDEKLIKYLIEQSLSGDSEQYDFKNLHTYYHNNFWDMSYFIDYCLNAEIESFAFDLYADKNIDGEPFPVKTVSKPLINLEYFSFKFPKIKELRNIYKSQIWYFDLVLEELVHKVELIGDYTPSSAYGIMQYYEEDNERLSILNPTIHDFTTGYFQDCLLRYFKNSQEAIDIVNDMNELFDKYGKDFFQKHIENTK